MALTLSTFRARHPEYTGTPDSTVQAALDDALVRTPVEIWGALQDQGQAALAAHLLALTPQGRDMRVGKDKMETLYGKERQRLVRLVSSGGRVTGVT